MTKRKELEKYCAYCGKKLERKHFANGRLEDFSVFCRRKYCDRMCMRKNFLKTGKQQQNWSNSHTTARLINNLLLQRTQCEICGESGKLDVHHIDGNFQNNNLSNLKVLCRSCHMKIHRQKSLCSVCGKPVKGFGYCEKHYQRFKKYGNPLLTNKGHGHIVLEN